MALKEKMFGDVAVVELKGKLMGGPETTEVHDIVKELIGKGIIKVVIDIGKVTWMNSTGLGAFMGSLTSLRSAKGDLKLACVTEKVKSLFIITKLISIFDTFENVEDAVKAFKK
jgi:anti-sigma B factor antagonist